MKVLNQHIKSLKPRDGAEVDEFWFDSNIGKYFTYRYRADFVCWADEMRCLSCVLSNDDSSSDAEVAVAVCREDGSVKMLVEKTVPADDFISPFKPKSINLKKNEYITVLSDSVNVAVVVSGYYLSGHEWFRLREGTAMLQAEYIGENILREGFAALQAECLNNNLLRVSNESMQAESIESNAIHQGATMVQVEYTT